ncbi:MAG TPA: hypothetical protein VEZ90_10270 [Blastocatellia bacterium]|nr:hypothetical protein [Blastocatellia bacterium]
MIKLIKRFFAVPVILFSCIAINGQEERPAKRIELKAGAPATVLQGVVRKDYEVVYTFSAKAGQKFRGRLTKKDGNIGFEVRDPNGDGLDEEEYDYNTHLTGSLKKTGDYKILVSTFETKESKYTLSVRTY